MMRIFAATVAISSCLRLPEDPCRPEGRGNGARGGAVADEDTAEGRMTQAPCFSCHHAQRCSTSDVDGKSY